MTLFFTFFPFFLTYSLSVSQHAAESKTFLHKIRHKLPQNHIRYDQSDAVFRTLCAASLTTFFSFAFFAIWVVRSNRWRCRNYVTSVALTRPAEIVNTPKREKQESGGSLPPLQPCFAPSLCRSVALWPSTHWEIMT